MNAEAKSNRARRGANPVRTGQGTEAVASADDGAGYNHPHNAQYVELHDIVRGNTGARPVAVPALRDPAAGDGRQDGGALRAGDGPGAVPGKLATPVIPVRVIAVDPGEKRSALVGYCGGQVVFHETHDNTAMLDVLPDLAGSYDHGALAIEMIASYGMPVGREVFETCVWIGRFVQAWGTRWPHHLVYRRDVKLYLCGSSKARDATIRTALLDKFGPGKAKAVGTKKQPGPLYGIAGDEWSALAVAVTFADGRRETP